MIKEKCFKEAWLDSFKNQAEHKRIDKIILEKMIYALHLLDQLVSNGLDFIFKGGTSLVLLLEEGNRFSIDIDIICKTERLELEAILEKVVETSRFKSFQLDDHRSYQPGVPKAHYAFAFDSVFSSSYSGKIILDVLIEDAVYPELTAKPIQTKWIEMETETWVTVPSIDAITGDKLTAFAPNTIGIPYFKQGQSFSMEICKQLYDLSKLFGRIQHIETVATSFKAFAEKEIAYRKNGSRSLSFTLEDVLRDTIDTCLLITKKGAGSPEEKSKFDELQRGIKALGTGFLMSGHFRIDDAVSAAARVAYLAAKLLRGDLTPIHPFKDQDIKGLTIEDPTWNFLNRLKRQPDKTGFYYWWETVQLVGDLKG